MIRRREGASSNDHYLIKIMFGKVESRIREKLIDIFQKIK